MKCTPWGSNPAKSVCGTDAVSSWLGVHEKLRSRESNPAAQAYETRWGIRPLSAVKCFSVLPAGLEPATVRLGRARSLSTELRKPRVPPAGLEPATSRFGTVRSHPTELRGQKEWLRQDLNLRPHGSQPCALIQLSYGTRKQGSGPAGIRTRVARVQTESSPAELRAHETEAAGGTRTRIVLSGAQVPHLSATAAKPSVLREPQVGFEPTASGLRNRRSSS